MRRNICLYSSELGELMDTLGIEASPEEIEAMIREVNFIALQCRETLLDFENVL